MKLATVTPALVTAVAMWCSPSAAQVPAAPPKEDPFAVPPGIVIHDRVDLELQQLYVTVTHRGEPSLDLPREVFRIEDEGQPQEIVTFEGGDVPFTAVVLLDGSDSMAGRPLEAALEGTRAFLHGMNPLDEAQVIVASDRPLYVSPVLTGDEDPADAFLDPIQARGGTALLDHLFLSLDSLERRQGRRVVVVLSDGYDVLSWLDVEPVLQVARRSQAMIYWVRLRDSDDRIPRLFPHSAFRSRSRMRENRHGLDTLVKESGGRVLPIAGAEDVEPVFRDILEELRSQYALGYYPEPRRGDGRWREVRVEVEGRRLDVRHRDGYYDQ